MRRLLFIVLMLGGCVDRPLDVPEGPLDAAVLAPISLTAIARVCTLYGVCTGGYNASECAEKLINSDGRNSFVTKMLACINESTCDALGDCMGLLTLDATACFVGSTCSGDVVIDPTGEAQFDCTTLGLHCVVGDSIPCCAVRACTKGSCDGNTNLICESNVARAFDCTLLNGACDPGTGTCVGKGAACDSSFQASCNGSVATICLEQRQTSYDCRKNPVARDCVDGLCTFLPVGSECIGNDSRCSDDGDSLRVCANSQWIDIACSSVGESHCALQPATCD